MNNKNCKFCNSPLGEPFLDLGSQPLCNKNIKFKDSQIIEDKYPLEVFFCSNCYLVQLAHSIEPALIFKDYTYSSSFSSSWLNHVEKYSKNIIQEYNLSSNSFVVEIASNDGYLLKNFVKENIPSLGIEPAKNIARESNKLGIETLDKFFNYELSNFIIKKYKKSDLIISNNVFAHIQELNDFTKGVKNLLNDNGIWTIEVPYLKNLIEFNQFDTIYHEHYFYYSILSLNNILENHGLKIFDIEKLNTHGGSLRIYATHQENTYIEENKNVLKCLNEELELGLQNSDYYKYFNTKVEDLKFELNKTLNELRSKGKTIVGYGAPGKGNTLLNYCGINSNTVDFTVDKSPLKQNTYLPGSRIPVYEVKQIKKVKPDYVLILPWNIKDEIMKEIDFIKTWGGRIIIPIPEVEII